MFQVKKKASKQKMRRKELAPNGDNCYILTETKRKHLKQIHRKLNPKL
jgi:hypothetical protein